MIIGKLISPFLQQKTWLIVFLFVLFSWLDENSSKLHSRMGSSSIIIIRLSLLEQWWTFNWSCSAHSWMTPFHSLTLVFERKDCIWQQLNFGCQIGFSKNRRTNISEWWFYDETKHQYQIVQFDLQRLRGEVSKKLQDFQTTYSNKSKGGPPLLAVAGLKGATGIGFGCGLECILKSFSVDLKQWREKKSGHDQEHLWILELDATGMAGSTQRSQGIVLMPWSGASWVLYTARPTREEAKVKRSKEYTSILCKLLETCVTSSCSYSYGRRQLTKLQP